MLTSLDSVCGLKNEVNHTLLSSQSQDLKLAEHLGKIFDEHVRSPFMLPVSVMFHCNVIRCCLCLKQHSGAVAVATSQLMLLSRHSFSSRSLHVCIGFL